jgi:hypothetical protein
LSPSKTTQMTLSNKQKTNAASTYTSLDANNKELRDSTSISRANRLADHGYISKAAQTLTSAATGTGLLPFDNPKVWEAFANKIAGHNCGPCPKPPASSPKITIDPDSEDFMKKLKSQDNGSAPDIYGWNGNLLLRIATNSTIRRTLADIANIYMEVNECPASLRHPLLARRGLAGAKTETDAENAMKYDDTEIKCPMSVPPQFGKFATSLVNSKNKDAINKASGPHQFGPHHFLREQLAQGKYALKTDGKNAHSAANRKTCLTELYKHSLPGLHHAAHFMYQDPTPCYVNDGAGIRCLLAQ